MQVTPGYLRTPSWPLQRTWCFRKSHGDLGEERRLPVIGSPGLEAGAGADRLCVRGPRPPSRPQGLAERMPGRRRGGRMWGD